MLRILLPRSIEILRRYLLRDTKVFESTYHSRVANDDVPISDVLAHFLSFTIPSASLRLRLL